MSGRWVFDPDPKVARVQRFLLRVLGEDRMERIANWVDGVDERREANRCTWATSGAGARCVRKAGHRGYCLTQYNNGNSRVWYGINFPERGAK